MARDFDEKTNGDPPLFVPREKIRKMNICSNDLLPYQPFLKNKAISPIFRPCHIIPSPFLR